MAGTDANRDDAFDIEQIRKLAELMEEHDLTEIDLNELSHRIRLKRGFNGVVTSANMPPANFVAPAAPAPAAPQQEAASSDAAENDANIVLIKSPMVGTFYSRPSPEAESFAKVGDNVSAETTVCIIEAMKLFNEIESEVSGKVVKILVDDASPVEFDQPLFLVDPS